MPLLRAVPACFFYAQLLIWSVIVIIIDPLVNTPSESPSNCSNSPLVSARAVVTPPASPSRGHPITAISHNPPQLQRTNQLQIVCLFAITTCALVSTIHQMALANTIWIWKDIHRSTFLLILVPAHVLWSLIAPRLAQLVPMVWSWAALREEHQRLCEDSFAMHMELNRIVRKMNGDIAMLAHEVRTPLNAMLSASTLLQDSELTQEQQELLQMISISGSQISNNVNFVLEMARLESGKVVLQNKAFSLSRVCKEAIESVRGLADSKSLGLVLVCSRALPLLRGDPFRLSQSLQNLLNNAIKFTASGSVTLSATILSPEVHSPSSALVSQPDMANVRFEVTDTGIGMSPEEQAKLFESFVQASSKTQAKYGGTGLGLVITRQIVQMMGGTLTIDPTRTSLKKGTTFVIELHLPFAASSSVTSPLGGNPSVASILEGLPSSLQTSASLRTDRLGLGSPCMTTLSTAMMWDMAPSRRHSSLVSAMRSAPPLPPLPVALTASLPAPAIPLTVNPNVEMRQHALMKCAAETGRISGESDQKESESVVVSVPQEPVEQKTQTIQPVPPWTHNSATQIPFSHHHEFDSTIFQIPNSMTSPPTLGLHVKEPHHNDAFTTPSPPLLITTTVAPEPQNSNQTSVVLAPVPPEVLLSTPVHINNRSQISRVSFASSTSFIDLKSLPVLVVEDCAMSGLLTVRILQSVGFKTVVHVYGAEEALQLIFNAPTGPTSTGSLDSTPTLWSPSCLSFPIILTDLHLGSKMDGWQLSVTIRSHLATLRARRGLEDPKSVAVPAMPPSNLLCNQGSSSCQSNGITLPPPPSSSMQFLGSFEPIVIGLSGDDSQEIAEKCTEAQMDGFLLKPVAREQLVSLISTLVAQRMERRISPQPINFVA